MQGLGLTSATMLVMGSMIGSGIFIVSAEIGREVDSPALLIGAWAVAGFMTIVAALSYGELAAMMPRAGGQYVYLREALGPLWGFLYGWTLIPRNSDRDHRRRGRGVWQVPGRLCSLDFFFPLASAHLESSADSCRADGAGQHGCRHQHAESDGDPAGDFPFGRQHLWSEDGRGDSEHLHGRQSFRAAGIGGIRIRCWGAIRRRWPQISEQFLAQRRDWARSTRCRSGSADRS